MAALALAACATQPDRSRHIDDDARATLAVLATSDLHAHVLGYDYYRMREDDSVGLDRVATLIEQARQRYPNTFLVDNGDTIQGTPLADWQAKVQPPACDGRLAIHAAMDEIGYDAGTLGNHEFNYGLPFLSRATGVPLADQRDTCRGPDFPIVLSNVVAADSGQTLFPSRLLLQRSIRLDDGAGEREVPLSIGVIGLTPPGILNWDARFLTGQVTLRDTLETARNEVQALRAEGADVVIALVHGGLDARDYRSTMDNPGWHLAREAGVDALVLGHEHLWFPDAQSERPAYGDLPQVDAREGRVHGIPAVMPAFWGRALGVIELPLRQRDGRWQVDHAGSRASVWSTAPRGGTPVPADPRIAARIAAEHQGTIAYVSEPVADSAIEMASFFADVGDLSALHVVQLAQAAYVRDWVRAERPDLAGLPVLSAAAPFKTGHAGANDYTQVPAGPLAIRHAADLYLYPNTLVAVKIDGAAVKTWLERSARRFLQIDPASVSPQTLIDTGMPGYNFDVLLGVRYTIDITRAPGERIVELRHDDGRPVADDELFLVATNNYRASSGAAFGLDASAIVIDTQVANRDVLIDWLRQQRHLDASHAGEPGRWRFAPIGDARVQFTTRAGLPRTLRFGPHRLQWLDDLPDGRARYVLSVDR